jgi:hypothetical protein
VDFDGTICDHEFPGIGAPKPFVKEALTVFRAMGFRVLIWTCRTCHWHYDTFGGDPSQPTLERTHVREMIAYLAKHGIPYDEIDDGSRGKPLAEYYIDDKGLRFENNWAALVTRITGIQV